MKKYQTDQEKFWKGKFGDDYIARNKSQKLLSSKIAMFSKIIQKTRDIDSAFEIGANIGLNLNAISYLLPSAKLHGIEINEKAFEELTKIKNIISFKGSILEFNNDLKVDFVFSCTVLIHINPEFLNLVYDKMAQMSLRYVLIAEYYNPIPVEVNYRGNNDCLFKRDFAGEFLERHRNFRLIDYSFVYHNDNVFQGDDITWFLMERYS